jgi:hypothetical protein
MRYNFIKICLLKLLSNAYADMNDLRFPTGGFVTTNRVDCAILNKRLQCQVINRQTKTSAL